MRIFESLTAYIPIPSNRRTNPASTSIPAIPPTNRPANHSH